MLRADKVRSLRADHVTQSRAHAVVAQLVAAIEEAEPGARLGTKDEVRGSVGVSPGTFNEALRLLQSRGLVSVRPGPGGGIFVAEQSPIARLGNAVLGLDIDQDTVSQAFRIRNSLEQLIVEDAIVHATAGDIAVMRESLGRMSSSVTSDDGIAFLRANWQLHSHIACVSPQEMLRSLYTNLLDLVEEHTISISDAGEQPLHEWHVERYLIHAALVEAIAHRDVDRAREVVREHNEGIGPRHHSGR